MIPRIDPDVLAPKLLAFAHRLGSTDAEARDLVQESFLRVLDGRRTWDAPPDPEMQRARCRKTRRGPRPCVRFSAA
jgi:DNA-directed RNA polymerase specialized sigma24 family protein